MLGGVLRLLRFAFLDGGMMIKPKSRKHEDRIKALEREAERMQVIAQMLIADNENYFRRICDLEARKWWQFWR